MAPPDAREIVFAGAGILWGATNFFRGLNIWRADKPRHKTFKKTSFPTGMIVGFALVIGCTAYLAMSVRISFK